MAIFSVLSIAENPELRTKIETVYEKTHLQIAPNTWFVTDSGVTTQEVCAKLGIGPGGLAGVIVVKVENYFGFASSSYWEWLKVKAGEP